MDVKLENGYEFEDLRDEYVGMVGIMADGSRRPTKNYEGIRISDDTKTQGIFRKRCKRIPGHFNGEME
jgi:hypothetical protein